MAIVLQKLALPEKWKKTELAQYCIKLQPKALDWYGDAPKVEDSMFLKITSRGWILHITLCMVQNREIVDFISQSG